ncbi:MAG: hypothetical protein GY894_02420 [Planctomycetes bacterium]|jgi:hypothetical protein|nr:hypothetical protein [Planctomycetota bacterium]MCP4838203.1 hypothetical protein [Planctomycetota bacterium]
MIDVSTKKKRLERLVELAQVYRNWSRRELAESLGRDPTKLIPLSGNPKLDFIIELADVLDWTIGDVTECLWNSADHELADPSSRSFAELDEAAGKAHARGDHREMIRLAGKARAIAATGEERALACNRELGGWDGLGRFTRSHDLAREGLSEAPLTPDVRRMLQSNLANACYSLWHLTEARTIASDLIKHFDQSPPTTLRERRTHAFSLYVLGSAHRRLINADPARANHHAAIATTHLRAAMDLYGSFRTGEDKSAPGVVRTCRGGSLEADIVTGRIDARQALATIMDSMSEVIDLNEESTGDLLESHGWWCIFGCNIALRHISNERELHRLLALFTNKADEIADRLDNWAMRERVFSIQFDGHRRFVGWTGQDKPLTMDSDDIRMVTGTMGRFPNFRRTGWTMLESARVVTDNIVATA